MKQNTKWTLIILGLYTLMFIVGMLAEDIFDVIPSKPDPCFDTIDLIKSECIR